MHFHHKHDIDGCTTDHAGDWPDWAVTLLATLDRMELIRMTAEQDAIDALAARIDAAEARIAAKLTAPAPDPVDLSPLAAVADKLDALVPADSALVDPAPVVDPVPVVDAAPAAPVDVPPADPQPPVDAPADPSAAVPFPSVPLA